MNNGQTRRKSPLATYEKISPNSSKPRTKKIRRLSPHAVAGNLSIESTLNLSRFVTYNATTGASTNYAIGSDGRIGLGVEETNRAWTTSSSANDNEAITFEIANDGSAPDWHMSDKAINAWMSIAIEIAKFYGFKKFNYQEKPSNISGSAAVESWIASWANADEMLITLHCWYAAKACPGSYFIRQLPWIVKEMNKRLTGMEPEAFVGEGATPTVSIPPTPIPPTPIPAQVSSNTQTSSIFQPYQVTINATSLNVRRGPGTNYLVTETLRNDKNVYTIIEEADGVGASKWCKLKSGIGWVSKDYIKRK